MKIYKIGDKIKIKPWGILKKEFEIDGDGNIKNPRRLPLHLKPEIEKNNNILTISDILNYKGIEQYEFRVKEFPCIIVKYWTEQEENINNYKPITSRFEILDIRD